MKNVEEWFYLDFYLLDDSSLLLPVLPSFKLGTVLLLNIEQVFVSDIQVENGAIRFLLTRTFQRCIEIASSSLVDNLRTLTLFFLSDQSIESHWGAGLS